jgi:hypothetical protein
MYARDFPTADNQLYHATAETCAFQSSSRPYERVLKLGIAASLQLHTPGFDRGPQVAQAVLRRAKTRGAIAFVKTDLVRVADRWRLLMHIAFVCTV